MRQIFAIRNEESANVVENANVVKLPNIEDVLLSYDDSCRGIGMISDSVVDFEPISDNKTRGITLAQLKASADIVNKRGEMVHGVNAYTLIQNVCLAASELGYTPKVRDLFVADSSYKSVNGIEVNKQLAEQYQEINKTNKIPFSATTFNRVYSVITLDEMKSETHIASIVLCRTQRGTAVSVGANCTMCRNMTIFGTEFTAQTYGKNSIRNEDLIAAIRRMLKNYDFQRDMAIIEAMKKITLSNEELIKLIGQLTLLRAATDSTIKEVNKKFGMETLALNNGQINKLCEGVLLTFARNEVVTLYDFYQVATAVSKPIDIVLDNIIPQVREIFTFLDDNYGLTELISK